MNNKLMLNNVSSGKYLSQHAVVDLTNIHVIV